MTRIEIKARLGSQIVTREHGRRLRDLVLEVWEQPPIVIDFDGLQVNSVSFFDESLGQLALRYGKQEINRRIRFEGLETFDAALVQDIISSRAREAQKRAAR